MLIESIIYLFIIIILPWGFGMIVLSGYDILVAMHPYLRSWIIGFFFMGGFVMSLVGLIGLSLAGRDSFKKAIKRIRIGRK
jgi:hypothetical protein